jgi:thiosulfate/3-mercaptopyruvate sulfurtransferase
MFGRRLRLQPGFEIAMVASEILIEPSALEAALRTGALVIDARKAGEFKKGHIPGAMPLSTYDVVVTDSSIENMRKFAQSMADRFSSVGVRLDRPVFVYDEHTGMRAARELWMLEFIGHRRARMLHGGLTQWVAEGHPVLADTDIATVRPTKIQQSVASGCYTPLDEVARRAGTWNFTVIDVRNDLEWAGKDADATPCCQRHGHIPGAIHIEWSSFLENGKFKPPEKIVELLEQHNINPRQEIAVYSHTGARSANAYFALRYAGLPGARNFVGSWHEWSARADLPVE